MWGNIYTRKIIDDPNVPADFRAVFVDYATFILIKETAEPIISQGHDINARREIWVAVLDIGKVKNPHLPDLTAYTTLVVFEKGSCKRSYYTALPAVRWALKIWHG